MNKLNVTTQYMNFCPQNLTPFMQTLVLFYFIHNFFFAIKMTFICHPTRPSAADGKRLKKNLINSICKLYYKYLQNSYLLTFLQKKVFVSSFIFHESVFITSASTNANILCRNSCLGFAP